MTETGVRVERDGQLGRLLLDRPKAINALTASMVGELNAALESWVGDQSVSAVLVQGEGRGLCAGGDMRAVRQSVLDGTAAAMAFWYAEYHLDGLIANYPKPIIVVMDGIVMGGGVGLSAYAAHRLVTDTTRLAMPETAIGYYPDCGVTWLLARCPGELGTHVALSGLSMTGADAVALGLADAQLDLAALPGLAAALARGEAATDAVAAATTRPARSDLVAQRDWIDECYRGDDPAAIVHALAAHPDPAAQDAARTLRSRSPFAVAVSLAAVRQAAELPDLVSALDRDYRLNAAMLAHSDLAEGVRTVLIDKGQGAPPRWLHEHLEDVPAAEVAEMFDR